MNTLSKTGSHEVGPTSRVRYATPRVDLHQDGDSYTLQAEMPGVTKEGLEVSVEEGKLILVGHRAAAEAGGRVVYSEREPVSYRRVFDLDPSIDPDQITATIDQGLLTIRLHKAEAAKPRKITVS